MGAWKGKHDCLEKEDVLHGVTKSEASLEWPSRDPSSRPIHLMAEKLGLSEKGLGLGHRVGEELGRGLLLHLNSVLAASSERGHGAHHKGGGS